MKWLTGSRDSVLRFIEPDRWELHTVILVVSAVVLGGLTSNLLATMISDHGWVGAFERHPVRAGLYAALVVGCAVTTTIVVLR